MLRLRRRTGVWLVAGLALLLWGTGRAVLLGAGAWLDRWEEHSLPGARPVAEGPRFRATWPPRLFWEEIRWETESGDRLRAGQLDV